jgi:hypothetical protein
VLSKLQITPNSWQKLKAYETFDIINPISFIFGDDCCYLYEPVKYMKSHDIQTISSNNP